MSEPAPKLVTYRVWPSGLTARSSGWVPTAIVASVVLDLALMTVTPPPTPYWVLLAPGTENPCDAT